RQTNRTFHPLLASYQNIFIARNIMSRLHLPSIAPSEITPEAVWRSRRTWLKQVGMGAVAATAGSFGPATSVLAQDDLAPLSSRPNPDYMLMDKPTSEKDITSYNNYYEFGTGKSDPFENTHRLQVRPWTVSVEGEVAKPRT